jgi:hypothetical protein
MPCHCWRCRAAVKAARAPSRCATHGLASSDGQQMMERARPRRTQPTAMFTKILASIGVAAGIAFVAGLLVGGVNPATMDIPGRHEIIRANARQPVDPHGRCSGWSRGAGRETDLFSRELERTPSDRRDARRGNDRARARESYVLFTALTIAPSERRIASRQRRWWPWAVMRWPLPSRLRTRAANDDCWPTPANSSVT